MFKEILEGEKYIGALWSFSRQNIFKNEYSLDFETCPNPFCPCMNAALILKNESGEQIQIKVDIENRKIKSKKSRFDFSNAFIAQFKNEISDEDWDFLDKIQHMYKYAYTKKYDVQNGKLPEFDAHSIQNQSTLVSYYKTFIWDYKKTFSIGGIMYLIDDQYCLNTKCDCMNSIIEFIGFKNGKQIIDKNNKNPVIIFDYKSNKWENFRAKKNKSINEVLLVDTMLKKINGISGIFEKRHNLLRILYRRYLESNKPEYLSKQTKIQENIKVGRNEKCPCGSGQKYKRCCGKK